MRTLIPLALAALLAVAPATAQDESPACPDGQVETPEGCSDQAWVEDCPPEHLCAAGEPQAYGDEDCIECSGPVSYGPDGCIDCTSAPPPDPETCMDGAQEGEACQDDVKSFGPGPADTGSDLDDGPAPADEASPDPKDAPFVPASLLLAALVGLVVLARRVA